MRPAFASLLIVGAILLGFYLVLVSLLYFRQDGFLFFPVRSDPTLARKWRSARVEIPSGGTWIEGWWAESPEAAGAATVLYFGGNAEDVLYTAESARQLHARRLLVTCYRGYGGSPGRPSQAALFADALAIYDQALRRPGVAPEEIVVMGRSLGSGVATYLASRRPVRAAILVTPFDSMVAVGQRHYPFFPVRAMLRNPFPSDELARRTAAPALILAGDRDDIIPAQHAERLYAAWAGAKELHVLHGAGHNDIEQHPDYYPRINAFLDRLQRAAERLESPPSE
jgi:fermentation-respiration switch protein FrsA (DUF1100 family)